MKCASFSSLFLILSVVTAVAQPEMSNRFERKGPQFHYDAVSMLNPEDPTVTRLDIYAEVMFDDLQFIKVTDGFEAKYEISVIINDKKKDQVDGKIWKENVFVRDYDITNNRNIFSLSHNSFLLKPGEYTFSIAVEDVETELSQPNKSAVTVKDFNTSALSISDLLFVSEMKFDSLGKLQLTPQVTDMNKGLTKKAYAYFEIYNPNDVEKVTIGYKITGLVSKSKLTGSYDKVLNGFRTAEFVALPIDSLPHDGYRVEFVVDAGEEKAKADKIFYIRWSGLPTTAQDLETAIEQLKYIATRQEWKKLRKAKGDSRLLEYNAFWKRHDPTPGTDINEAMIAHYNRIEYANRNFSVMQRDGWKTDMGMLYVLLGAPDDIYRESYPVDSKPYQIWRYYRINREFLFYDYTGFGDYRFASPYSIYEIQRYLRN